jgi:hypothetical protein
LQALASQGSRIGIKSIQSPTSAHQIAFDEAGSQGPAVGNDGVAGRADGDALADGTGVRPPARAGLLQCRRL